MSEPSEITGRVIQCTNPDDLTTCEVTTIRSSINALFLFITLGSLVFTFFVMFVVEALRARRRQARLKTLPCLLAERTIPGIRSRGGVSKRMHRYIASGFDRTTIALAKLEPVKEEYADKAWGAPGTEWELTHFQTNIASSYTMLHDAASRILGDVEETSSCTVREIVEIVKLREGVDGELCDQFLRYYENARFGNKQITQQMYLKFIKVLYEILLHFDEQQLEGEGKKREDDDNGKG